MRILLATSEVVPFAKTGGLADVCGALPAELSRLGHEVAVILPAYREAIECGVPNQQLNLEYTVPIGSKQVAGRVLRSSMPNTNVPVYLIEQDDYFDRPQLYGEKGIDYKDNCERFVFFCRSVMETVNLLDLRIDVLHCNDWQTGLIPAYLRTEYEGASAFDQIVTVMTIHNMAYQGQFWHWDMLLTGLDWKYFNWHQMEFWGKLNLLKTGLVFADSINTVSPRYALEIQTEPLGCGLEGVLAQRSQVVHGILNGVNYASWNPQTDPHIVVNYGVENWRSGKAAAKKAVGEQLGLPVRNDVPMIGMVGRLVDQKGLDLVAEILPRWLKHADVQWVVLGKGEARYHDFFRQLAVQFPEKIVVRLEFSDQLAHAIEAGADMLLMPSRYEPCGLNQLYSLKYGTVPIVRSTGGLADTILDADATSISAGTANGFRFDAYQPDELDRALQRAIDAFARPDDWAAIVTTGMRQDWSWTRSARRYIELYEETTTRVRKARGQRPVASG